MIPTPRVVATILCVVLLFYVQGGREAQISLFLWVEPFQDARVKESFYSFERVQRVLKVGE